jgi:hypothetical protein
MEQFLKTLFDEALDDSRRLCVFTLPDRWARHFSSVPAAVLHATKEAEKKEVYFGLGLASANFNKRNKASDIVAIAGFWADIDLATPWRTGKRLPGSTDEAMSILEQLPFEPSLLIDSGHGIHAYWLFKEPWIFESDQERIKAAQSAKGWVEEVRTAARGLGWDADPVGDLARVLRLPDTFNRKGPEPVQVRVVFDCPERRYNPEDFEEFAVDLDPAPATQGEFVLRPDADPPADKFAALTLASPAFEQTWNCQRLDLADQSQSSYDLSLATIAALNGWSDQEIADLVIAARRCHGQKPRKALRQDYIARTIASARRSAEERLDQGGVDLSGFGVHVSDEDGPESGPVDPGPMPDDLLRVPGFISEVMDYCLDTAPYPNQVLAFCGALAMQAFLAGRKVRDPGDNRTNIYLLGLAHSAAGKDWPRKVNIRIAHELGMGDCFGDRFASGEGIQDALFVSPSMLFQTDEIDGMLQSISKSKDARYENVMGTLLTMHSAANSIFPMRRKAGKESAGIIDQPCFVLFGTAIPNHYYEALSERMLTNGFFARMIILEGGPRAQGQEPRILKLPPRVVSTAKWWADFRPGNGNLANWHPVPVVVEHTDEAKRLLVEAREEAEAEYAKAEESGDAVGTTVWGRAGEQTRKLALIYAVSENHASPRISLDAARWATRFIGHQTRRMLFMADTHAAASEFDAACLKIMRKLREAPGKQLAHSVLLKRMKIDSKAFLDLIVTLEQRGDLAILSQSTATKVGRFYQLLGGNGKMREEKE